MRACSERADKRNTACPFGFDTETAGRIFGEKCKRSLAMFIGRPRRNFIRAVCGEENVRKR